MGRWRGIPCHWHQQRLCAAVGFGDLQTGVQQSVTTGYRRTDCDVGARDARTRSQSGRPRLERALAIYRLARLLYPESRCASGAARGLYSANAHARSLWPAVEPFWLAARFWWQRQFAFYLGLTRFFDSLQPDATRGESTVETIAVRA